KKSWTKKDILKRCEELAEQIIRIYPYREAKTRVLPKQKINYSKNAEMILSLNTPSVTAQAIRHHNGDVEVLPGSVMKAYGKHEMKGMQDIYRSMEAKGIFHETDNNRVQFAKSWHFYDLNIAAQFLMHRGGENTSMWKKEDGSSYPQDEETNTIRKQVKKKTPSRLSRARRNNVYKF
ncbi:MAG: hypothetical protein IJ875_02475, partial [Solobacterium sp.]|nr:hypothetical protein [Solobacterium sp.]